MFITTDIHPEANIFFISFKILEMLSKKRKKQDIDIMSLYKDYNAKYYKVSFNSFLLAITTLFALNAVKSVNEKGNICI